MFKNFKISTKMFMSFGLVAVIALTIGLTGFYGLSKNDKAIEDIGFEHMPAMENVYRIKEQGNEILAATRTMMDLSLDKSMRQRQYDRITGARKNIEAAWKEYVALPHSPEVLKQWQAFEGDWGKWRTENNFFLDLSRKIDELDLGDPMELRQSLDLFRGDHYKLTTALLKMINDGKQFEGGDNHEACNMGKWLPVFKTTNPAVQQLRQEIAEPHRKFHEGVHKIKELVASGRIDEAKSVYAALTASMETVFNKLDELRKLAANAHNMQEEAKHQLLVTAHAAQLKAFEELDNIVASSSVAAKQKATTAAHEASTFKIVMMSTALTGVGLAMVIAFLITRAITTPLSKAVGVADELSKGNLTVNIKADSNDETGQLLKAMDTMTASLRAMFTDISKGVETLTSSSTELAAVSLQLTGAANDTSGKSSSVATASEEMNTNFQSVSAAMEQSTSNLNMIATSTEEMTATVREIAVSAEKARVISDGAVKQSKATSVKMTDLGEAAKKIGRVTETITEISEQTNLLALNATIEAARAGEAGKGFAVVANEIKELARQTAEATVDIKNQIGDMQSTTNGTIEDIANISEVIAEINNVINAIATAVEEQSAATNEIAGNIAQASQGIAEVNENVAHSSMVVTDITRDVSTINSQAGQVGTGSVQVQTSAQALSNLAIQLKDMVSKFKV